MQVSSNKETIYPIGVIWNMGNKFAREIMLKIAINQDVIQVRVYDLKEKYDSFVLDCYNGDDEAFYGGYIYEKIKNMKKTSNTKAIIFTVKIDNPTYSFNKENGVSQCIESRAIKQKIRDEYSNKIDGYFFDTLIHMSDNEEESQRILKILNKYEQYVEEDYIRKGYQPIITRKIVKEESKSYTQLLKKIKRDEER